MKKIKMGNDPGRMKVGTYTVINGKEIELSGINAISTGYERRVTAPEDELKLDHIDLLDVTIRPTEYNREALRNGLIEDPGKRYFIADMARRCHQGDLLVTADNINKYNPINAVTERVKIYAYTGLSAYHAKLNKIECDIACGMPQEEYWNDDYDQDAIDFKAGFEPVEVTFNHPKFNGYQVIVSIDEIDFYAEGTATSYSARYDYDLIENKVVDNPWMKELLKKGPCLITNLGSSSDDYAIIYSNYIDDAGNFGVPVGSNKAILGYKKMLMTEHNLDIDKISLDYHLCNYEVIEYRGVNIPIREQSKPFFMHVLQKRMQGFHEKIESNGFDIGFCAGQFQSGGTAAYWNMVAGDDAKKYLRLAPHLEFKMSDRPHSDEARGYFIMMHLAEEAKKEQMKLKVVESDIQGVVDIEK